MAAHALPGLPIVKPTSTGRVDLVTGSTVVSAFEDECVEFFAEVVQIFGIPKSVGQIYGILYASPCPLSFSDIVARLGISKGSASQGMQLLRVLGAIIEADRSSTELRGMIDTGMLHTNRVVYEPELSLRRLVNGVLRERIAPLTSTSSERLRRLRVLAGERWDEGERNFYVSRARQLGTWQRRLKAVLPVLGILLASKPKRS